MSGARPDNETAKRMGMVPYATAEGGAQGNADDPWTPPPKANSKSGGGYPTVTPTGNNSYSKGGNFNDAPSSRSNDQLWTNGSGGFNQGSAPAWPKNEQGAPINPNSSFQSKQPGSGGAGAYVLPPQSVENRPGAPQQQQQQQQRVSEGIPVADPNNWQGNPNSGGYAPGAQPSYQGQSGGQMTQGPPRGPMPKGDYVYYDGNGNQIYTDGGPGPTGPGGDSGKHFHHHHVYNQQQQPQVGYPYDKNMEKKKKRKPGAAALAGALLACWVCTCCCHAPCGC